MQSFGFYILAAVGEIAGCFAFWAWLRLGKPVYWIIPGALALVAFAFLLTRHRRPFRGPRLCGLRRRIHRRLGPVAVVDRGCAAGPLGHDRSRRVSLWRRYHLVGAAPGKLDLRMFEQGRPQSGSVVVFEIPVRASLSEPLPISIVFFQEPRDLNNVRDVIPRQIVEISRRGCNRV